MKRVHENFKNLHFVSCLRFLLLVLETQFGREKKTFVSQLFSLRTRQTNWVVGQSRNPGMNWWSCRLERRLMWEYTEPFPHRKHFWCELRVKPLSYFRTPGTNLWSGRGGGVWTSARIFISWACYHSAPLLHWHPPTAFLSLWSAPPTHAQLFPSARLILQSKQLHPRDAAWLSLRAQHTLEAAD